MKLICLDDKNKPKEIPESKFVKEGEWYELLMVIRCMPGNIIGFQFVSPELDETCLPYICYLGTRFAMLEKDIKEFEQLCRDCSDLDSVDLEQLIEESQLEILEQ